MYITNVSDKVRILLEQLEQQNDETRLKAMIYIFERIDNDQINDRDIVNPKIEDNDDLEIFTLDKIGLNDNTCEILLQYLAMMYRGIYMQEVNYIDSHIIGLEYNETDKKIISQFERLTYNEKLDVITEIIIRFDNNTYFEKHFNELILSSKLSGFDLAKTIQELKI